MSKQLVIIGGGPSIREGISMGLWSKLENKFTIGINYAYNFINPTLLTFCDKDFYKYGDQTWSKQAQKQHRVALSKLSLIIGPKPLKQTKILSNTILIPTINRYYEDISHGIYRKNLSGLFTLTLGIYLLEPKDELFLIGYDFGQARKEKYEENLNSLYEFKKYSKFYKDGEPLTHFYQDKRDLKHNGFGKYSYYNQHNKAEKMFSPYKKRNKVSIYNVCPTSRIPGHILPKMDYETFFKKLQPQNKSQEELRNIVKSKLNEAGYS